MDERLAAAASVLYAVGYCVAVVAMLTMVIPGLRPAMASAARRAVADWRYGRWLGRQPPPPPFFRELRRADLPDEVA